MSYIDYKTLMITDEYGLHFKRNPDKKQFVTVFKIVSKKPYKDTDIMPYVDIENFWTQKEAEKDIAKRVMEQELEALLGA